METELIRKYKETDLLSFPDFYSYKKPLEMGLWILWTAKEKFAVKKMTAQEISSVARDAYEISVEYKAILRAFSKAGHKIHIYKETDKIYYEIMKPGKDHLISLIREGSIDMIYFEPEKRYSSKRLLSTHILDGLNGDISIVDPFCGLRTLDILASIKKSKINFLTKIENLREADKIRFLRELKDFNLEHAHVEFRNYPYDDLHDRYVLSSESLVLLGHSIKDLGSKESFAVILNKKESINTVEAVIENFNRRWKQAVKL